MTSTMCSRDDRFTGTENQCRFLAFLSKFRPFSWAIWQDFDKVHAVEKSRACSRDAHKSGIVVPEASIRACALKLEFG